MWCKRGYNRFFILRRFCSQTVSKESVEPCIADDKVHIPEPEYDTDFICDPSNRDAIFKNIQLRKSIGDIDKTIELSRKPELREFFMKELSKIPNCTDPAVQGDEPRTLREHGCKPQYSFAPLEFSTLAKNLNLTKMNSLSPVAGQRSYVFFGDLAKMEEALTWYSLGRLMKQGFKLVSVPDIIPTKVIERCGLVSDHSRTMVYTLDNSYGDEYSLSGTAEMSLAYKLMNRTFSYDELPFKVAAVSRCFRAEASSTMEERGIYRVHQFTKVEMFACSEQDKSMEQFQELVSIQEDLFSSLGLHYKVVDMPPTDLGPPAYRKVDIEGWMPGRQLYGELSSCSNCTDFQARRLHIKYKDKNGKLLHVHTLNGTACAIPRMLIALCETHQTSDSHIAVPEKLIPYMDGKTIIAKQPIPKMRLFKCRQKM